MNKRKPSHPPYDKLKGFLTERGLTYRGVASLLGIFITSVGQKTMELLIFCLVRPKLLSGNTS